MKTPRVISLSYGDRLFRVIETEPLQFVAKDVCEILTIKNNRDALAGLDDDEKGVAEIDTPGGIQKVLTLYESGFYTLLIRSNKQEAKPFRRWVTHEVLPCIRRTGSYSVEGDTGNIRQPAYKTETLRRMAEDDNALELMFRKRKQGLMEVGFDKSVATRKAIGSILRDTGIDLTARWDFQNEEFRSVRDSDVPEKSTQSEPDELHADNFGIIPAVTDDVPKNYRGWNLNKRGKNKKGETLFNLVRKVGGKKQQKYLGVWDRKKADQIIDKMNQDDE